MAQVFFVRLDGSVLGEHRELSRMKMTAKRRKKLRGFFGNRSSRRSCPWLRLLRLVAACPNSRLFVEMDGSACGCSGSFAGCVSRILKDKQKRMAARSGVPLEEGVGATGCVQILCCLLKFGVGSIGGRRSSVRFVGFLLPLCCSS